MMYGFFHVRAWLEINLSYLAIFMTPDHPRQVIHKIIYDISEPTQPNTLMIS